VLRSVHPKYNCEHFQDFRSGPIAVTTQHFSEFMIDTTHFFSRVVAKIQQNASCFGGKMIKAW
jgi:hypothetical protein